MSYDIGILGNYFQDEHEMITVAIQVGDLINKELYQIDYYTADLNQDHPDQGYQRRPQPARVSSIAKDIVKKRINGTFLPMPTSLILSDRGVNYKFNNGKLTVIDGKFKLIDGQHRVLAYKKALEEFDETEDLASHYFSCTIIKVEDQDLSDLEKKEIELKHFNNINGKAKPVPVDLGNALLFNLYKSGALKNDEFDFKKIMAIDAATALNDSSGPWMFKLQMPNEKKYTKKEIQDDPQRKHLRLVKSTSLVTSLKPIIKYLHDNVFRTNTDDKLKQQTLFTVLDNYWTVINQRCPESIRYGKESVIQKSSGIFSFHMLLENLMKDIKRDNGHITNIEEYEKRLDPEASFLNDNYWKSTKDEKGEATRYGSMGTFKIHANNMYQELLDLRKDDDKDEIF